MTKRTRRLPMALLAVGLVVALAGMGLVWAHWTDTLEVHGQVETGHLDAYWIEWDCNDIGSNNDLVIVPLGKAVPPEWIYLGQGFVEVGRARRHAKIDGRYIDEVMIERFL